MKQEGIYQSVSRKRDTIIKNAPAGELPPEYEEARQRMEDYLRAQQKRCTVERRFVLTTLYQQTGPIDMVTLHERVCSEQGQVARTTVYNTVDLLVQLKLARRVELVSHGMTFVERTLGAEPHGYAICEECGVITVLHNPDLLKLFAKQLPRGFVTDDITLHIHGLCGKCSRKRKKKKKNL